MLIFLLKAARIPLASAVALFVDISAAQVQLLSNMNASVAKPRDVIVFETRAKAGYLVLSDRESYVET